ncbi:MAG: geranylgeranyl diphosphate synthase type II [Saprospiraceae bacterium]|jgi:geranylgeranyl diphosphate synthase type II
MMQTLSQFQERFQTYLTQNQFNSEPTDLYAPVNYILSIGGKRLRPVLVLMSHALFEDNYEKSLPAAFAVEVFHNFTLLHDDIMDEAPLRRGKPTVHVKYDVNTGILSGDVMMIAAYDFLSKIVDETKIPTIYKTFNKVAIEVCEGQQYDMNFETRDNVTILEYLRMIELKTSVLLAGAMQMGAIIGNASAKDAEHIYQFGRNVGLAFQIQDDILDTYGDPEKFGKKVGGDIVQNKKTYLVLKALETADEPTKDMLLTLMTTPTTVEAAKIEAVKTIFNQLSVRDLAEAVKEDYLQKAFEHLDEIAVPKERKKVLIDLANDLMMREV